MPPRFADWSSRPVSTVRRGHDLPRHAHASRPELSGPSVALRWPKAVTSRSCLHLRIGCRHRIKPSTVGQPAGICLVETLGYEVAGSVSQKRDGIGGLTVLGKGKLAELAAITGGTGVVGGWTAPQ